MTRLFAFLCATFLICLVSAAQASKRMALVIGNDIYSELPSLQKAANDAKAISTTLKDANFAVTTVIDADRRGINRSLQAFASRIEKGDEVLFFFAGHGVEIEGRNYLLPTDVPDVKPGSEQFIKAESIPVDQILDTIQRRGARVSILILDACRENPFSRDGTRSVGSPGGLGHMSAAEGTFILYSAGVGQLALDRLSDDDQNPNSIFTRSLIPLIRDGSLSLAETARQVRRDVQKVAATVSYDQRPAYYDEITGDFFFGSKSTGSKNKRVKQPTSVSYTQAYLYEEGTEGSGAAVRTNARVSWSLGHNSTTLFQKEPVIQAILTVPDKKLGVNFTIRRNTDKELSASHIIEILFDVPDDFAGGHIDNVARFVMKPSEEVRGEALVAVPVKVKNDYFLVALDNLKSAQEQNSKLLRNYNWIDVPITYENGRRALITMKKGELGRKVFETAMNDWVELSK